MSIQQMQTQNAGYSEMRVPVPALVEARLDAKGFGYDKLSSHHAKKVEQALQALDDLESRGEDAVKSTIKHFVDRVPHHNVQEIGVKIIIGAPVTSPQPASPIKQTHSRKAAIKKIVPKATKKAEDKIHRAKNKIGQTVHPEYTFRTTPGVALSIVAGCHGYRHVFVKAVQSSHTDVEDLYAAHKKMNYRLFFDQETLRTTVQNAAVETVAGNIAHAGNKIRKAHHLVAMYLKGLPNETIEGSSEELFRALMNITGPRLNDADDVDDSDADANIRDVSAYSGALAGICLGGALRFAQRAHEQTERHQQHATLVINAVGAAIAVVPFPPIGAITGVIAGLADPIGRHMFEDKPIGEQLIALGGDLEATIRRGETGHQNFDPEAFCNLMQETIHRCGFAF
ncbi:hypothetical protein EI94DRAFT_1788016 [Lactarius quietus]|nr:hypothetical protein EI94DRAFT_1788016 [Lactarius quietus]